MFVKGDGYHWAAHKGLQLYTPPSTASPPLPQWLNTHSYRNTAALRAQPARPGWGCTAAQKAHFNNSDSDFPKLSLRKDKDLVSCFFF